MVGIRHHATTKNIQLKNQNAFHDSLYADRVRIKEILYNLLNNAVKFTPEAGRVWIEAARQGEALHISVCDTGIGIPEKEQPSIFEKFYQVGDTTGGVREGTGLGLPITKHLVELHGGAISVASRPGKGSSFRLVLPLSHEQPA
jgi:signal transduction histidine kinase